MDAGASIQRGREVVSGPRSAPDVPHGLRPPPSHSSELAEPASGEVCAALRRTAWQMEREGGALSKALAVSVDGPAMTEGDLSGQP